MAEEHEGDEQTPKTKTLELWMRGKQQQGKILWYYQVELSAQVS